MTSTPRGIADLSPLTRRKEQRAWYWYYLAVPACPDLLTSFELE